MKIQSLFYLLIFCCLKRTYVLALIGLCLAGICLADASFAEEPLPRELVAIGTIGKTVVLERDDTDEVFAQIATHGIAPREIIPSADGRLLFVITEGRRLVEVIDVARNRWSIPLILVLPAKPSESSGLQSTGSAPQIFVNVLCVDRARDAVHPQEPQIWALTLSNSQGNETPASPPGSVFADTVTDRRTASLRVRRGFICDRRADAPDCQDHPFPVQHRSRRRFPSRFVLSAVSSNQPFELSDSKNRSHYEKGLCWLAQF